MWPWPPLCPGLPLSLRGNLRLLHPARYPNDEKISCPFKKPAVAAADTQVRLQPRPWPTRDARGFVLAETATGWAATIPGCTASGDFAMANSCLISVMKLFTSWRRSRCEVLRYNSRP